MAPSIISEECSASPEPHVSNPTHRGCIVCGGDNDQGMHLKFHSEPDGSVRAEFRCDAAYQGYPDILHGGVVAAILDGAMTNCLFAHNIVAVTAELNVRYLEPVRTGEWLAVRARTVKSSPHLYLLEAELLQRGSVHAKARAKFRSRKA
jgi:uncharacterized protein (TIGR00369 family)